MEGPMREEGIDGISREFDRVLSRVAKDGGQPGTKAEAREALSEMERPGDAAAEPGTKGEEHRDAFRHRLRGTGEPERAIAAEADIHGEKKAKDAGAGKTEEPGYAQSRGGGGGGGYAGLLKPRDSYIAAFLIPVVIMIIIFAQRGIFPFGDQSFLRTDMYHQYAPFFSEFKHKLSEGGSLLYSWDIGMGVNFAALYAYYLASPLNWLLFFCPGEFIIEFMTCSIVLKIGLSGLTFTWYLRRHFRTGQFGACFFGIFYALSGYMAAYSWNIMWLDCIVLFPVILLGLERLVREKNGFLYCAALGLSILSNYYISIMICIFMVIYFIALAVTEWDSFKDGWGKCAGLFAGCSLLAGGLAAAVLLPEIYALQSTASGDMNFPAAAESYFSIVDMLARHIGNVQVEIGLDHWPNIYCGVAVLLFFLLYLACRSIPLREKAVYCSLLLLFLASFSINVLNFIWHGFHYPNSLPARQSFIYIALMLIVCFRAYMNLEHISKRSVSAAFFGSVSFVLLAQKFTEGDEAYHFAVFYGAIFFLAVYAGLIFLWKREGGRRKTAAVLLALLAVSVEAAVNTTCTSVTTTSRTAYTADNEAVETLAESLKGQEDFYRIEKADQRTKNDGAWMHFPSVSLFSSVANADVTEFMKRLGCEASTNAYSIKGSTPLVDCLLAVKYAFYPEEQKNPRLDYMQDYRGVYLYANRYALPLGFMVPDIMENEWRLDMTNPADAQNALCGLFDAPDVLVEAEGLGNGPSLIYTPEEAGEFYAYVSNRQVEKVSLKKGEEKEIFDNVNRGYFIEVGQVEAGETLTFQNEEDGGDLGLRLYRYNEAGLEHVYRKLAEHPFELSLWEDRRLKGSVDAGDGGTLFTSIPYDEGWAVTVDGEEKSAKQVFGAFLGIELLPGSHVIELTYMPKGLKEGAAISAVSLLVLAGAAILARRRKMRRRRRIHERLKRERNFGKPAGSGGEGRKRQSRCPKEDKSKAEPEGGAFGEDSPAAQRDENQNGRTVIQKNEM